MRENFQVIPWRRPAGAALVALALATRVLAGGSGLNVAVVVNQNSTNSVQLGNYYCEQRAVPPQNLIRINWAGGNVTWTLAEFETLLRAPLTAALGSRTISNQIDYVLLAMDIPYRVTNTTVNVANNFNATTAALFYGFKDNLADPLLFCSLAAAATNRYAGSEGIFRQTPPLSASSNSWLTFLLTATNLTQAKALVDWGVRSDATFPTQSVFLTKSTDAARNLRFLQADNTIFNTRLHGAVNVVFTNTFTTAGLGPMFGFQNGWWNFNFGNPVVAPGAMMDDLTSFSGFLFESSGHTTALDFINHGATASYGTITEPCAFAGKFPAAQNYFYQVRGFSIGECYYQSLTNPYQGILVGEPLAAPFALPASGSWVGLPAGALLTGPTNLSVQFTSASLTRPVQQVDLFFDGRWLNTVSNLAPQQNNLLSVTLNGFTTSFTVPAGATIKSVASGLGAQLNAMPFRNNTQVTALVHGDRIELQSLNLNVPGPNLTVSVSHAIGSASLLTTFVTASRPNFLDTPALGFRAFTVVGTVVTNDYLRLTLTKTNGAIISLSVTNQSTNATLQTFVPSLLTAVNAEPTLTGSDGVVAEDLLVSSTSGGEPLAQFNLRTRAGGWPAAQVQAQLTGSFTITPGTPGRLEDNLNDLRPRNHLYITAGLTNWNLTFPFNPTTNADGYHELTAVAYEGSHVRTQKRLAQNVRLQNHAWSATLTSWLGGTNTALEATLQFAVVASTNNITQIEFFTTGGLFATSNNVSAATFAIAAGFLGIGLHPFYALVTRADGRQYRTDTQWIRIVGAESPFNVSLLGPAPTLTWPASAGRSYQVLSATNLTHTFTPRAAVTPTNFTGRWLETNNTAPQRYYRVKTP